MLQSQQQTQPQPFQSVFLGARQLFILKLSLYSPPMFIPDRKASVINFFGSYFSFDC